MRPFIAAELSHTSNKMGVDPQWPLIQLKFSSTVSRFIAIPAACRRRPMAQTTVDYLERRLAVLEKEIEEALHQSPIDDLAVADLKSRKLIIADEIQHNRRLVERFRKLGLTNGLHSGRLASGLR